jgi:hypothetical protein
MQIDYAEISRQARERLLLSWVGPNLTSRPDSRCQPSEDGRRPSGSLHTIREGSLFTLQLAQKENRPRKRVKYSRSTNGCFGCRQQKVKCDETTPTCLRCIASQRECRFPETNKIPSRSPAPSTEGQSQTASQQPVNSTTESDSPTLNQASDVDAPGSDEPPFMLDLDSLLGPVLPHESSEGPVPGTEWINWDLALPPMPTTQPLNLEIPAPADAVSWSLPVCLYTISTEMIR